jgi:alpha-beta hydrolase superfamily lysophospholipase
MKRSTSLTRTTLSAHPSAHIEGKLVFSVEARMAYIVCLSSISDMLNSGQALLDKNYRSYPASLPLLVFHGNEDQVTWHDASQQFVEKVKASDKQFISLPGYYHEAHNEVGECVLCGSSSRC